MTPRRLVRSFELPELVRTRECFRPVDLQNGTGGGLGSPINIALNFAPNDLVIALDAWRAGNPLAAAPFTMTTLHAVSPGGIPSRLQFFQPVTGGSGTETWLNNGGADDYSRTALLAQLRRAVIEDSAVVVGDVPSGAGNTTVPTMVNPSPGSMLVAFAVASVGTLAHNFSPAPGSPLVEMQQHTYQGAGAYNFPMNAILAIEERLPVGSISGRQISLSSVVGGQATFGVIVRRRQDFL